MEVMCKTCRYISLHAVTRDVLHLMEVMCETCRYISLHAVTRDVGNAGECCRTRRHPLPRQRTRYVTGSNSLTSVTSGYSGYFG